LSYAPLQVDEIIASVGDDGAGATAVFLGTTRNSFKGKVVTRLEYQAYSKLALKTMQAILTVAHQSLPQLSSHQHQPSSIQGSASALASAQSSRLIRTALYHRLGPVPVGELSIVIAVSSPHRREAFLACEYILEEVKKKAQIWKREFYEGE
ncbi:Molybdopterin biosynthesis MoaE, partial [Punctularia strigosozonata HHB-11173 SS5]|uniref:Molybdopterin biosynthesis MoaE n=1 Tax=Punctularia strigosozonata (strain HHB-11173) TaxID=741275 RepID=UPI0004416862